MYKFLFSMIGLALVFTACKQREIDAHLKLWYDEPATVWTEALPVGNGRIGGMVYGDPLREVIQFNEETLWTGEPHEYQHTGAHIYLDTLRQLLFEGKQREADQLAMQEFMSVPLRQKAYQPFGDLIIEMAGIEETEDYHRELDLEQAMSRVSFTAKGLQYHREVWVSYPDQVMAIRLTVNERNKMNFDLAFNSPHQGFRVMAGDESLILRVKVENGVLFGESRTWIHETDGQTEIKDSHIEVRNASSALILLTAGTSFRNFKEVNQNPAEVCETIFEQVREKSYKDLRKSHLADYAGLFDNFDIDLGTGLDQLTTDERLNAFWKAPDDPSLLSLYVQYGRYLMISSSRGQGQPANLQGIWNDNITPPWDSKWTVNINTEMNYWPVELTGLQACAEPLFKMVEECAISGAKVAQEQYNCRGWVLHHNTDIWRGTAPINAANHGIWVTGGAWLTSHLWEHYLFSQDLDFLRDRAWPLMKGSASFFVDYLVEDPITGWLISGPSNSPENGGLVMGPTMDHQIIRSLFKSCVAACDLLNTDQDFKHTLESLIPKIAPNQIGQYGQLQEWLVDQDNPNNKHRHVSHLWGVHPGNDITWAQPELMKAAKQSLLMRGDEGTGWSLAWKINFWSRFYDGNHAYKLVHMLLSPANNPNRKVRGGSYPNLFDAHPPFQIDGNFGGTAGIIEMLAQSHDEGINLLPALPDALPNGTVKGLRARGGFVLDMSWSEGKLADLKVVSTAGGPCLLRYGPGSVEFETEAGNRFYFDGKLEMQ